jgi:hypothetical protein
VSTGSLSLTEFECIQRQRPPHNRSTIVRRLGEFAASNVGTGDQNSPAQLREPKIQVARYPLIHRQFSQFVRPRGAVGATHRSPYRASLARPNRKCLPCFRHSGRLLPRAQGNHIAPNTQSERSERTTTARSAQPAGWHQTGPQSRTSRILLHGLGHGVTGLETASVWVGILRSPVGRGAHRDWRSPVSWLAGEYPNLSDWEPGLSGHAHLPGERGILDQNGPAEPPLDNPLRPDSAMA